jgi:hypothetical protein
VGFLAFAKFGLLAAEPAFGLGAKREAAARIGDWGAYTAHKADVVAAILESAGYPD